MSIATQITRLQTAKANIKQAIEDKGVDTTGHGLADYAEDIEAISTADPRLLQVLKPSGTLDLSDMTEVTNIRSYQFAKMDGNNTTFDQVILPDTITIIGKYAFYRQKAMTDFVFPSGLQQVLESAFQECEALTELDLPDTLMNIGNYAFQYDKNVETLHVPTSLSILGTYAFAGCEKITTFACPAAITTVPVGCFRNDYHLQAVTSGAPLTSIGDYAFQDCRALSSIDLSAVKTIGNYAFGSDSLQMLGCQALEEVDLSSVTSIGALAFHSSGIKELEIPTTLTSISSRAFGSCLSLKTLKYKARSFGNNNVCPFRYCTSLKNVWISANCVDIAASSNGSGPFSLCENLTRIYCEAASKPSKWDTYWHYKGSSHTVPTVYWGTTEEEFDAIVAEQEAEE